MTNTTEQFVVEVDVYDFLFKGAKDRGLDPSKMQIEEIGYCGEGELKIHAKAPEETDG